MAKKFDLLEAHRRIFESALPAPQKLVAIALLDHWSEKQSEVFPSVPRLADMTSQCERTVKAAIDGLESAGVIVVTRTTGAVNRYHLNGLMSVPKGTRPKRARPNRGKRCTGAGDAPVQQMPPTSAADAPAPVQEMPPKEPIEVTQGRNPNTKRSKSAKSSPANPGTKPLFEHYLTTFRRRFGQEMDPVSKKQIPRAMKAMKELAETDGLNAGKALIEKALSLNWEAYHTPWGVLQHRTAILAAQPPKAARFRQDTQTPIATGTWEPDR